MVEKLKVALKIILLALLLLPISCVESIAIDTEVNSTLDINTVLVVEARLTNELKTQQIKLSRGAEFANDSIINFEKNARVRINDDSGNTYKFVESEAGLYYSEINFAAETGRVYQLQITTANGEKFESEKMVSAGESRIDAIYAERIISNSGLDGMGIFVDSSDPLGSLNDYRYEYEETYKIIAPNWTSSEFRILSEKSLDDPNSQNDVELVPRAQEEQTCYNTVTSTDILLSDGVALKGTEIKKNLVRFINRNDPILSHRYSILVKQYLQTPDAANFYRTLLEFSQSESDLFSQVQPGFIQGNITATDGTNGTAIGFFDVTSVIEKRLFFNYEDFYPNEPLPPYFGDSNCDRIYPPLLGNQERDGPLSPPPFPCPNVYLIDLVKAGSVEFFLSNTKPPDICEGPYYITQRPCGDCTALGSNIVPDFWEE